LSDLSLPPYPSASSGLEAGSRATIINAYGYSATVQIRTVHHDEFIAERTSPWQKPKQPAWNGDPANISVTDHEVTPVGEISYQIKTTVDNWKKVKTQLELIQRSMVVKTQQPFSQFPDVQKLLTVLQDAFGI
jgi:hypothetical protein